MHSALFTAVKHFGSVALEFWTPIIGMWVFSENATLDLAWLNWQSRNPMCGKIILIKQTMPPSVQHLKWLCLTCSPIFWCSPWSNFRSKTTKIKIDGASLRTEPYPQSIPGIWHLGSWKYAIGPEWSAGERSNLEWWMKDEAVPWSHLEV